MPSFQTCENHGDAVIVYPYGYREKCPCCEAISEKEDLEHQLEEIKSELETSNDAIGELLEEINDLKNAAPENQGSQEN